MTIRRVPLMLAGLLLASTAACAETPASPGATPTTTTKPPVPACPVGTWTSTGVTAGSTSGVTLTFDGGSGVKVTIGDDGKVKADFSGMKPVTFSAQVLGTQARGEISYQGTTDGTVDLKATSSTSGGSSTPSGSTASGKSGPWSPTGTVNVADLKVTAKVTQPVAATVLDGVKVSDVTGSQTAQAGSAIDLQPLLRTGTYKCGGEDTLTITTSATPSVVWALSRA